MVVEIVEQRGRKKSKKLHLHDSWMQLHGVHGKMLQLQPRGAGELVSTNKRFTPVFARLHCNLSSSIKGEVYSLLCIQFVLFSTKA